MLQGFKSKIDYSRPFVSKMEERLESDFSKPNLKTNNTLANDLASLARYLHGQGLTNRQIAGVIDVGPYAVAKWTEGKSRNASN